MENDAPCAQSSILTQKERNKGCIQNVRKLVKIQNNFQKNHLTFDFEPLCTSMSSKWTFNERFPRFYIFTPTDPPTFQLNPGQRATLVI